MTTKKIDRNDDISSQLVRNLITSKKSKKAPGSLAEAIAQEDGSEGVVDVGLSSAINTQLNPETMAAERKAKVARLKDLISSGKYNPSSELVAQALHDDLVMEIVTTDTKGQLPFGDEVE